MEGEQDREQTYMLIETMQEGDPSHNEIQGEEVQDMITSQLNSHDQQFTNILLHTSMVDASHEETITEENDFRAKNIN